MERIGTHQLYVGVIMFILGSAPLFELGIGAQQNAWLAMTLGAASGLPLLALYLFLYRRAPSAGLTELYRLHFGVWIGSAIAFVHGLEQTYEASRLVRDYGEVSALTLLNQTPLWLLMLIVSLLACYTVAKGVEVLFRVIELLFPVTLASFILIAAMLYFNNLPDIHRMLPLVDFRLIARAAIPDIMALPYGQIVSFLAIWHFVKDRDSVPKTSFKSYLTVAAMLIYGNAMIMAVLGPQVSRASTIPMLQVIQLIRLGGFIERLDIMGAALLFFGLYIKLSVLNLTAVLLLQPLLRCSRAACAAAVGAVMYAASFWERSYTVHASMEEHLLLPIVLVFQLGVPIVMLVIGIRRKAMSAEQAGSA